jgi:hypothetical protein
MAKRPNHCISTNNYFEIFDNIQINGIFIKYYKINHSK